MAVPRDSAVAGLRRASEPVRLARGAPASACLAPPARTSASRSWLAAPRHRRPSAAPSRHRAAGCGRLRAPGRAQPARPCRSPPRVASSLCAAAVSAPQRGRARIRRRREGAAPRSRPLLCRHQNAAAAWEHAPPPHAPPHRGRPDGEEQAGPRQDGGGLLVRHGPASRTVAADRPENNSAQPTDAVALAGTRSGRELRQPGSSSVRQRGASVRGRWQGSPGQARRPRRCCEELLTQTFYVYHHRDIKKQHDDNNKRQQQQHNKAAAHSARKAASTHLLQ